MKIIVYTHEFLPWSGGIATYNAELAYGLAEVGADVLVLAPQYGREKWDQQGDPIYEMWRPYPDSGLRVLRLIRSAASILWTWIRYHPDVIIATDGGTQRITAIMSLILPLPIVLVVHGKEVRRLFENDRPLIRLLRKPIVQGLIRAKAVIAVSQATRDTLLSFLPRLQHSIYLVQFGVKRPSAISVESQRLASLRNRLTLASNTRVILTVARLIPGKGQDNVIRALPVILKQIPNVKYVIVGDGECAEALESLAKRTGVLSAVRFVGNAPREEVWSYYALCDVFAMPSRRINENFGIVFLEAASMGKPAVGGRRAGMSEAVIDGKTGILVDPDSIEEIADAIVKLLMDEQTAAEMGHQGFQRYTREFSTRAMAKNTMKVLQKIVDEP